MMLAMLLALASVSAEQEPSSPCDHAIAQQRGSNVFELSAASEACENEAREDDTAFLEMLTRIRASADLTLLPPEGPRAILERPDLQAIVANQGRFADEELARDPKRFDALMQRVREADLSIPAGYSPGWTVAQDEKRILYVEVIDAMRADILAMENYVALLVRDDPYFAAYRERQAMLSTLSQNGAQLPARYEELATIMQARVDVLGDPPTRTAVTWRKVYAPNPRAPFTVLHRGFNGLAQDETALFRSATELRQSWVAKALSREAFEDVLSRVDFETEVLGLYAVGEMVNATENLFVTEFGPQAKTEGHSIAVRVGVVVDDECAFASTRSYPFVLVKAASRAKGDLTSSYRANYPDQCAPVMAGQPTATATR